MTLTRLHDFFGPEIRSMTDAREQFLAAPWPFYKRFFLDPSGGLLREYWDFCQEMSGKKRPAGPPEVGNKGEPSPAGDDLRAVVESSRGTSVATAIERYQALPEGTVRQALDTASEVVGDVDTDVYLIPGLSTANAMTPTLGGRTVVVLCLDQNKGSGDLVTSMTHELSHCALASATEPPVPWTWTIGQMMYSEGLAVASSLAAANVFRNQGRSGSKSGDEGEYRDDREEKEEEAEAPNDGNVAAALWFTPEVLAWCRSNEASLWAKALPALNSGDRQDSFYWFAKFSADNWQQDGFPCRAGYYLGYSAVSGLLDRLSIREAHRLPPGEWEAALLTRAKGLGVSRA